MGNRVVGMGGCGNPGALRKLGKGPGHSSGIGLETWAFNSAVTQKKNSPRKPLKVIAWFLKEEFLPPGVLTHPGKKRVVNPRGVAWKGPTPPLGVGFNPQKKTQQVFGGTRFRASLLTRFKKGGAPFD